MQIGSKTAVNVRLYARRAEYRDQLDVGDYLLYYDRDYLLDEPGGVAPNEYLVVMAAVLHQWSLALADAAVGDTLLLPYSLDDQWIECLLATVGAGQVELEIVWHREGGYCVDPWNLSDFWARVELSDIYKRKPLSRCALPKAELVAALASPKIVQNQVDGPIFFDVWATITPGYTNDAVAWLHTLHPDLTPLDAQQSVNASEVQGQAILVCHRVGWGRAEALRAEPPLLCSSVAVYQAGYEPDITTIYYCERHRLRHGDYLGCYVCHNFYAP